MDYRQFILRLALALLCGVIIGVERQWRQRTAGLRTYALVSVGSALFVLLACLTPGDSSPTRIASQIVTGVGFLGAGVIMRSGLSVRGLNTAATIWCSSAVGTLAGSGYFMEAVVGAIMILAINLCLQPLVSLINRQPVDPGEQEVKYTLQLTTEGGQESSLRALLVQLIGVAPLVLHQVESARGATENQTIIKAVFSSPERQDAQVEQLASRMCLEKNVTGLTWQLVPHGKNE
jgi:putative Mg2+ transporter-C (MgtC) family protein